MSRTTRSPTHHTPPSLVGATRICSVRLHACVGKCVHDKPMVFETRIHWLWQSTTCCATYATRRSIQGRSTSVVAGRSGAILFGSTRSILYELRNVLHRSHAARTRFIWMTVRNLSMHSRVIICVFLWLTCCLLSANLFQSMVLTMVDVML